MNTITESYPQFLDQFFEQLAKLGIDTHDLEMDHIGYQATSEKDYLDLKPVFTQLGTLLKEDTVNGRSVGIVKLHEPWTYHKRVISVVEWYAPKKDQLVCGGWEHAEFVLRETYDSFMKKHPALDWVTTDMHSVPFSQIKLNLDDNMMVKFHLKTILEIIAD